jgi:hypothetical protein
VDEEKATQTHTKEKQNPGKENDDPIVKQVRQSSDLSTHERTLLRCIVNPGKPQVARRLQIVQVHL